MADLTPVQSALLDLWVYDFPTGGERHLVASNMEAWLRERGFVLTVLENSEGRDGQNAPH